MYIELINKSSKLEKIRQIDERLMSYNIEMTEITGGTFWKTYTPAQIAGIEEFKINVDMKDFTAINDLMQYYTPINLYDAKLRKRAKELGPAWIRVSGSWATKTYYDFDGITNGVVPKGYASILTKAQWIGVLDFVKAVDGKLLISVSNCDGDHTDGGQINLLQTKKIFELSHEYGVDIDAIEFMNEPNMLEMSGAPKGYTSSDFVRDQDIVNAWVRTNYPNCLIVGPCTTGDPSLVEAGEKGIGAGLGNLVPVVTTDSLMEGHKVKLDVFSYHYYNGVSERLASVAKDSHWSSERAITDEYLQVAPNSVKKHLPLRDKYVPNGQVWVTESGDAGGGGNTWASTYLDVFRTLNELGSFAELTDGVIFHNTLASSDYGFLDHNTFNPRPNYYAVLLWNKLMGKTVYKANKNVENLHIYCHSSKNENEALTYLIINNSILDSKNLLLPCDSKIYSLSAETLRSSIIYLNGKPIQNESDIKAKNVSAGIYTVEPKTCVFIEMNKN